MFMHDLLLQTLILACIVSVFAGFVKGLVGFGMPMIMISGLSSLVVPEAALAGLILPTLATNGVQAFREGPVAAWQTVRRFWVFLSVAFVMLLASAQLVPTLPQMALLVMLGGFIVVFVLIQFSGHMPRLPSASRKWEVTIGLVAGFTGGLSGIWGPPTVAYLTALRSPKSDQMRVQGVIYGLGSVALVLAHLVSGVLNTQTVWLSLFLIAPAMAGMWIGGRFHDRINQHSFQRATLFVLLIAGLNLLRRGLI